MRTSKTCRIKKWLRNVATVSSLVRASIACTATCDKVAQLDVLNLVHRNCLPTSNGFELLQDL